MVKIYSSIGSKLVITTVNGTKKSKVTLDYSAKNRSVKVRR